ncbi:hypothetical protein ABHF33_03835 [Chitinibacter sp. FCG-7]|uniref:Uncharacterized protein n=1 Tax=Chitinibacter mangrovi TaxID=3153927 RepID=A0AAU7FB69_9NEIS
MAITRPIHAITVLMTVLALTACGGGGSAQVALPTASPAPHTVKVFYGTNAFLDSDLTVNGRRNYLEKHGVKVISSQCYHYPIPTADPIPKTGGGGAGLPEDDGTLCGTGNQYCPIMEGFEIDERDYQKALELNLMTEAQIEFKTRGYFVVPCPPSPYAPE